MPDLRHRAGCFEIQTFPFSFRIDGKATSAIVGDPRISLFLIP